MAPLSIVVYPHGALAARAAEITDIDGRVTSLARDMAEAMYAAPGVGLAANQVGELIRLIVIDVEYAFMQPKDRVKRPIFLINPVITKFEGKAAKEEGCLSFPELTVEVDRRELIQVEGHDLQGNPLRIDAGGLLARAIQHEMDHLDGRTILDHASALKKNLYKRRQKKAARREA
jgi:peptide deformylase